VKVEVPLERPKAGEIGHRQRLSNEWLGLQGRHNERECYGVTCGPDNQASCSHTKRICRKQ
jgi:hypothetical protein